MSQRSIYRSPQGEAAIHTLYDQQLARLDMVTESLMVPTRFGATHVLVGGPRDGSPLVLLHGGNTTNPSTLGWLLPLLAKYRTFALDSIGHPGKSAAVRLSPQDDSYGQWVADVLGSLGLTKAAFVAGSYGAGILLRTAACAPECISRAVLLVPSGLVSIPLRTMLFGLVIPLLAYQLAPSRERLSRVLRPMFVDDPISDEVIEMTEAVFQHVNIEPEMPRNVTQEELARYVAPTLVLAAEKDRLFPAHRVVARARKVLPHLVAAEIIAGSPHFISPGLHPQLNQRIDRFLTDAS